MTATKKPKRNGPPNPLQFPAFRSNVSAAIKIGLTAKEGAGLTGISYRSFCRYANKLGYRMMYVNEEERRMIEALRGLKTGALK